MTEPTTKKKRLSRYKQELDRAPSMIFTQRDKEILESLWKYRFLTIEALTGLFGSRRGMYRRMAKLFHNGYVAKRLLFEVPVGIGSAKDIYLLDRGGARALELDRELRRKVENRLSTGHRHLKHSLAISDFQLALHLALDAAGTGSLESFTPDMEDKEMRVQVEVPRYRVSREGTAKQARPEILTLWPDASFSLTTATERFFYFLEVDQADRKKERVFKRFLAYWKYVTGDRARLREQRGVSGAFVLFIAPDEKRRGALIQIANQVPEIRRNRPGFWFINQQDISIQNPRRLLGEKIALGLDGNPGFLTKF
jgi:Replication-relaxation